MSDFGQILSEQRVFLQHFRFIRELRLQHFRHVGREEQ